MKLFAVHFNAPLNFLLSFLATLEISEEEQMLLYNSSDCVANAAFRVQLISGLRKSTAFILFIKIYSTHMHIHKYMDIQYVLYMSTQTHKNAHAVRHTFKHAHMHTCTHISTHAQSRYTQAEDDSAETQALFYSC